MITPSYYGKRKENEAERVAQIGKASDALFSYLQNNKDAADLDVAASVIDAIRSRETLSIGDADIDSCLTALVTYYAETKKPVVIVTATLNKQAEMVKRVQKIYRNVTGKKAVILNNVKDDAQIIVVHGVNDVNLTLTEERYADYKGKVIINDCIVFCNQQFLFRDLLIKPDSYDLNYGFFPSKYDTFVVMEKDLLDESAARYASVHWNYIACKDMLSRMLYYAKGIGVGVDEVQKALDCLMKINDKAAHYPDLVSSGNVSKDNPGSDVVLREDIDPGEFDELGKALSAIDLPPASEWGAFYSKELQAGMEMLSRELKSECEALDALSKRTDADEYKIFVIYRRSVSDHDSIIYKWDNLCMDFVKDVKNIDGEKMLEELLGARDDMALILTD